MKESARALAFKALQRWSRGSEFADRIVAELFARSALGTVDRAFALELFYGVLRNLSLLDFCIAQLRSGPVDSGSREILRLGLYQVILIETAAHAAVYETVALAGPPARGLVNALLRRALREKSALMMAAKDQPLSLRFSHPDFLVGKWTKQFGTTAAADLCHWNNRPAPVYAHVNSLKISPADFIKKYPESAPLSAAVEFVKLPEPGKALAAGDCYIQDPSTGLACELLAPLPNDIVLDACAAPGGKAAWLAALMANTGTLVAVDRDAVRVERLRGNLLRLGVTKARVAPCDWREPESIRAAAFEPQTFHKILVDAPCSNTGVMRRRVDVRWRLRADDFSRMQTQQIAILRNVAPLLKPGGSLVYSTCSLEPEENEEVIERFLREQPAFRLKETKTSLPFRDGFDGAFAARLDL